MRGFLAALALSVAAGCVLATPGVAAETRELPRGFRARVEMAGDGSTRELLRDLRIDVDAVFSDWARIYVVEEQFLKLRHLGLEVSRLTERPIENRLQGAPSPEKEAVGGIPPVYHTYETLGADLARIAADHPEIVRRISIGTSVQGRDLWMMKISKEPDLEEDEPEFAFLSSMHGDEVVGKELCIGLIEYLTDNYGIDARVTDLVDRTEIWILPSMNPDGTALGQRWNANNTDLNRDFPDQFVDPYDTPVGREPETAAVMQWAAARSIVLSANMHGGALVVNYPFDGNPEMSNTFSPSPDQDLFVSLSRSYADRNPPMSVNNTHPAFDNGITNGADWFSIAGGMQDWNYIWNGALEITLEVSETKWPAPALLPGFWSDNLESMLSYLERANDGVRGLVTDAQTGAPVSAEVRIGANPFAVSTDASVGDFHRPLLPGTYELAISATGFVSTTASGVSVTPGRATRRDVALAPLPTRIVATESAVLGDVSGDGRLDPDESADLSVFVRNLGATAASLSGDLEATGWFADVTRVEAGYPDLAPGASGRSEAPHHGIHLDASAPVGHKAGFVLHWSSETDSGVSEPFFVATGSPRCNTVAATGFPLPVSNSEPVLSPIEFVSDLEISDVRVAVDLTHPFIGDLRLVLHAPSGSSIVLHDGGGGAADDIRGTYGVDLVPIQPLADLDGEVASGTWTLEVTDRYPADSGWLNGFSLEVCGFDLEARPPEMRFRDFTLRGGEVEIEWWPYPGLTGYRVYRSTDPSSVGSFLDVTGGDDDATDTRFLDVQSGTMVYYLVSGVGPRGEGPKGHLEN